MRRELWRSKGKLEKRSELWDKRRFGSKVSLGAGYSSASKLGVPQREAAQQEGAVQQEEAVRQVHGVARKRRCEARASCAARESCACSCVRSVEQEEAREQAVV